jgi:RecG-like helicase
MKNFIDGEGISISQVNGNLMITNTMPNRNTFKTIKVLNTELVAKHPVDTLTLSHDNNIGITVDSEKNQIHFSLNTSEITSNINNLIVSTKSLSIGGTLDNVNNEYSISLTAYHKLLDNSQIVRTAISNLTKQKLYHQTSNTEDAEQILNQIENLEEQLLNYDLELVSLSKRIDLLSKSISNPTATFTYNPVSRTVHLDKPLASSFILENLTTERRNTLINADSGRVIFNTSTKKVQVFDGNFWIDLH